VILRIAPLDTEGTQKDVKTQKERSEERRQEKLAAMQDQIEQGTLKVRKMTPEERKALPPRPTAPKRRPR